MSSGHLVHVIDFAIGGSAAMIRLTIPTCNATLYLTNAYRLDALSRRLWCLRCLLFASA